jgi:predicted metal-dependent phosphoesterase TrpH
VLKVELHSHTSDDPVDRLRYTTTDLIDRAAAHGYDALAVTLHDRQLDLRPFAGYARERDITLIPGTERTIEGKHVLLLNFRRGVDDVKTFDDLARLRRREPGLVIAPHPYFPGTNCLHGLLDRYADLFDAVEFNAMFTRQLNFNRKAERFARAHGKPVVGNGDIHRLQQLGTTWSVVDAERDAEAICRAVREGRVEYRARPLSWLTAGMLMADLFSASILQRFGHDHPAPAPAKAC